jgi:hypothetical protein
VTSPLALGAALLVAAGGCRTGEPRRSADDTSGKGAAAPSSCGGPAKAVDGRRKLALVVGVGAYRNRAITQLAGPANDARAIAALLTTSYGFPPENVCVLTDAQATTRGFEEAFDAALVRRVEGPKDVAVLYFAGHGSQAADREGDEEDGLDETLLFHDARTDDLLDYADDQLNDRLAALYARTRHVVVLLDSCNSGTATRAAVAGTHQARFQPPAETPAARVPAGSAGGLVKQWLPASMPEAVFFSAATDGTSALETGGRGIFTDALVAVLGRAAAQGLTYAQAARQVPSIVAAASPQIPLFQGNLDLQAFGTAASPRPAAWEVRQGGATIELAGPPTPGMGREAELRVYRPGLEPRDYVGPAKAKATVVVDGMTGLNARAHVVAAPPGAPAIEPGDLAVLVRPGAEALRTTVRLRPEGATGGIPRKRAEALRAALAADPDATSAVTFTDAAGDFELALAADGRMQLLGPENRVRNVFARDDLVVRVLWQHALQKPLRLLRGETGGDFVDGETLQVRLVPARRQEQCGERHVGAWVQGPANGEQVVPLCVGWNVEVKLSDRSPHPLLVGGVILSSDGSTLGFPEDRSTIRLQPGESAVVSRTYLGTPPLDVQDTVRVFGTQLTNPVRWSLLTQKARTRDARGGTLERALGRYLGGTRGVGEGSAPVEDTTWTASTVTLRVEANPRFARAAVPGARAAAPTAREYTLASFDVTPYLPDDHGSATARLLRYADELARREVSYKQHPWSAPTEEENIAIGVDCSHAVMLAFVHAGLRYNARNRYITTAQMVGPDTPMKDEFVACDGREDLRLGDVLVYRDATRGDGHTVIVIDPARRIAWGSHGWDGSAQGLPIAPDNGVEFQLIKYKPDWARWDRKTMELAACWRHRKLAEEAGAPAGQPGTLLFAQDVCTPDRCRRAARSVAAAAPPR